MTTTRDKEQTFARLFRLMDSPFEAEALNAFRQARRMLQEESATFGAILDHTQHLKDTNVALDEQNRDLHLENEKFRGRSGGLAFARGALGRFAPLSSWLPQTPNATMETPEQSGEASPDAPRRSRFSWTDIPKDLRTLLGIFAIVAVAVASCHMLTSTSDSDPRSARSASAPRSWLARLPANFSVDRPPWCFSCRNHQEQSGVQHAAGPASSGPTQLPTNFSIDHPPWCPACRHQQAQPDADDHQRRYGKVF